MSDKDTIYRQDALDALEEQLYLQMLIKNENPTVESKWYGINWARNTIADLPPAQPERKKGKWIPSSDEQLYGYRCSECHRGHWLSPFCPYCGADMRGEQDE